MLPRQTGIANHKVVLRRRFKDFLRPKPFYSAKKILGIGCKCE